MYIYMYMRFPNILGRQLSSQWTFIVWYLAIHCKFFRSCWRKGILFDCFQVDTSGLPPPLVGAKANLMEEMQRKLARRRAKADGEVSIHRCDAVCYAYNVINHSSLWLYRYLLNQIPFKVLKIIVEYWKFSNNSNLKFNIYLIEKLKNPKLLNFNSLSMMVCWR